MQEVQDKEEAKETKVKTYTLSCTSCIEIMSAVVR